MIMYSVVDYRDIMTNDERLQRAMDELGFTSDQLNEVIFAFSAPLISASKSFDSLTAAADSFAEMHAEAAGDGDKLDDLIVARMEGNLALDNLGLDLEHEKNIKRMADIFNGNE